MIFCELVFDIDGAHTRDVRIRTKGNTITIGLNRSTGTRDAVPQDYWLQGNGTAVCGHPALHG